MKEENNRKNNNFEMNNWKNISQNNNSSNKLIYQLKNDISSEDQKENLDSNKAYLMSDNSQSAINPLNKSREYLNTSNITSNNNLFTLIEYNNIEKMNELLKQDNSHINDLNEEGLSLLHIAVIKGNIKMINLLLSYGADPNILSDKMKQTPLHLAYLNQNSLTEDIIKELLKFNANESIFDKNNKKPNDYLSSTSKKKRLKNFNIYYTNENNNSQFSHSDDKKNYINNVTGNTVTVVTIDNHLDSFLTTNKEEESKNNLNSNTNSTNNKVIQTPIKLDIDYDFNDIISLNNSGNKTNNQINNELKINLNKLEGNKNNENESCRRHYTFGKEEDFLKFQKKSKELSYDINNDINNNNIIINNNLENIDINNNYFSEGLKRKNSEIKDEEEEPKDSNSNPNKNDIDITQKEDEILTDSLEENNQNEKEYNDEEKEEENKELNDSLKNSNISNKENNIHNSFNLNNNSLTYTESINVNGSNFQSKNKLNNLNIQNGNNNNINENIDNEKEVINEIVLSPYPNDKNLDIINMEKNEQKTEEISDIDDILLTKIITKKRDSFRKSNKNGNLPRVSIYSTNVNRNFRNSAYNNNILMEKNDLLNNSLKSNKTSKTNYLSPPGNLNKISKDNKNSIKYLYKKKNNNNLINRSNSYKNNKITIDNRTDSRIGFSGDVTQFSTQTQNNKKKYNSKDKIKVIMNENSGQNSLINNSKITEFHYNDNTFNNNSNTNDYNCNEVIENANLIYLKYWLNNIGLIEFESNFTNNNVYNINDLIERMKSYQTKLSYETLESILKIRTPGYIFRILCKLEADAGLIDPKIVKFMIRDEINNDSKNLKKSIRNNESNLNISITKSYYQCLNCCKLNQVKKGKKNDLKYFLLRYNLLNLYQNFYHNGFDMIEYVIVQMYSSFPINDDILENYFHIYNEKQRKSTLKAIVSEMKIINRFMNSDEYNNNCDKNKTKYDNIIFEENYNQDKTKIHVKNSNILESDCFLF